VVLALGGVAGGGIRLAHSFAERAPVRPFELSVSGDLPLALDGRPLDDVASLHGVDLTASGLSLLERVGVSTDGARVHGYDRIFAAGDVVAGRPRTMLEAVRAGCEAARQLLAGMPR
jgi:glycerol-3-phosphate dehydrogenase subunit B